MSVKKALREEIVGTAAVTALIGTRMYYVGNYPKTPTYPLIQYQRIGSTHERHLTGGSGKRRELWQIDCYAETSDGADALADEVRKAMDNATGSIGSDNAVTISGSYLQQIRDAAHPANNGAASNVFRASLDFAIRYSESVTT